MDHATLTLGEYQIPLIGVPPSAVQEKCDICHTEFHIQRMELTGRYILCHFCKDKLRWRLWTGLLAPPIYCAVLTPDKGLHHIDQSRWFKTEQEAKDFISTKTHPLQK